MTFDQARDALPENAELSCTFGYPGVGGYTEYHRTPGGRRFKITNGPWDALSPFDWTMTEDSP